MGVYREGGHIEEARLAAGAEGWAGFARGLQPTLPRPGHQHSSADLYQIKLSGPGTHLPFIYAQGQSKDDGCTCPSHFCRHYPCKRETGFSSK